MTKERHSVVGNRQFQYMAEAAWYGDCYIIAWHNICSRPGSGRLELLFETWSMMETILHAGQFPENKLTIGPMLKALTYSLFLPIYSKSTIKRN